MFRYSLRNLQKTTKTIIQNKQRNTNQRDRTADDAQETVSYTKSYKQSYVLVYELTHENLTDGYVATITSHFATENEPIKVITKHLKTQKNVYKTNLEDEIRSHQEVKKDNLYVLFKSTQHNVSGLKVFSKTERKIQHQYFRG